MSDEVKQPAPRASVILHEEADNFKQFLSTRLKSAQSEEIPFEEAERFLAGADGLAIAAALLRGFAVLAAMQEKALDLAMLAATARTATPEEAEAILRQLQQQEAERKALVEIGKSPQDSE